MLSHETACILNTNKVAAHVEIMIYFSDRDPVGPHQLTVPPHRTLHQRFNDLKGQGPRHHRLVFREPTVKHLQAPLHICRIEPEPA